MQTYTPLKASDITAKIIILSLLSAGEFLKPFNRGLSIADLTRAAALFDIDAGAIRVAAARLVKEGLLESPERGRYCLPEHGHGSSALSGRIRRWQTAHLRTTDWQGGWLGLLPGDTGRSDRKQLRLRDRACRLFGFEDCSTGLAVRPDNLLQPIRELRDELFSLGVDDTSTLIRIDAVLQDKSRSWEQLWDTERLEAGYRAAMKDMATSLEKLGKASTEVAAKGYLLTGQAVITAINLDPLLPQGIIDFKLFSALVRQMQAYDRVGRESWSRFFD